MGASQSSLSSDSVIATGVIAIAGVAAGLAYHYQKRDSADGAAANEKQAPSSSASKKGGKKKGGNDAEFDKIIAQAAAENAAAAASKQRANVVAFPDVVPGSFDGAVAQSDTDAANAKKKEKKARKKAKKAVTSSVGAGDEGGSESASASSPTVAAASASRTLLPTVTSIEESIVHVPADGPSEPSAPAKKEKGKKKKAAKSEGGASAGGSQAAGAGSAASASASAQSPGPSSTPKPTTASKPSTGAGAGSGAGAAPTTDTFDDGSWTRVTSRKSASGMQQSLSQSEILTSDTNLTASGTNDTETSSVGSGKEDAEEEEEGEEEEEEEEEREKGEGEGEGEKREVKRKTFAEKMLPKRRTGVEDMEEEPLQPSLVRVLRITPGPNEKPAKGFSWGDYEDVNLQGSSSSRRQFADGETSADGEGDDGWMVKTSRRRKFDRTTSSTSNPSDSPSPSSSAQHHTHHSHTQTAPETLAKRQRQNAAKRDAAKADKQAVEAERLARLARHKKEVERARIEEQWKHGGGSAGGAGGAGGKKSGGMVASVDEKGGLVWE